MPRNRVIYQTEALYVGPSPCTGDQSNAAYLESPLVNQIHRVQSANYGYSLARRDVNQYGELAAIDRVALESPAVNLDFSYLNSTFFNEAALGFYINSGQGDSSCITYILDDTQDDRNYFIKTVLEGVDAINNVSTGLSCGFSSIGNGFISNFQTEGAVGDFPKTSITVEALNVLFQTSKTTFPHVDYTLLFTTNVSGNCVIDNPAVDPNNGSAIAGNTTLSTAARWVVMPIARSSPATGDFITQAFNIGSNTPVQPYTISALRPGDINLSFFSAGSYTALQEAGTTISDMKIQSYNLSFALTRDSLNKLGSKYAFAKVIRFPVNVSLSVEANIGDITTGNLTELLTNDRNYDIAVKIGHPQTGSLIIMQYTLKNAKLDSQSYSSSIGPNKTVTYNFTSQIGGPLQTTKGLFFSGYMPALR